MSSLHSENNAVGYNVTSTPKTAAERQSEWHRHNYIFESAEQVGADYIEACGVLPTEEVMAALQTSGFTDYSTEEIMEVFHDWEDFQTFAEAKSIDRVEQKRQLAAQVRQKIEDGELPLLLAADYCNKSSRALLTGGQVDDIELISRYARYNLSDEFIEEEPGDNYMPTKLAIALSIDSESGKVTNRPLGELLASKSQSARRDIEQSSIYREWYYFLFPKNRKTYLKELLAASSTAIYFKEFEYYYNRKSRTVTAVGKSAYWAALISSNPYLNWLKTIGKLRVRQETQVNEEDNAVFPLSDLIVTEDLATYGISREEKVQKRGSREAHLAYGRFLVELVKQATGEVKIDEKIIQNARTLGIGFSVSQLYKTFGNLARFYVALGVGNSMRNRQFGNLTLEYFATAVSQLGERLGHRPNRGEIDLESRKNVNFPSHRIATRCGFTLREIYEQAGWPDVSIWGAEECEKYGLRFMLANGGMEPSQAALDFLSTQKRGPSATTVSKKYAKKFGEYKSKVIDSYKKIIKEGQIPPEIAANPELIKVLKLPEEFLTSRRRGLRKSHLARVSRSISNESSY